MNESVQARQRSRSNSSEHASITVQYASPVASGGHLYFATEDGEIYVVKAGPTFELVATNKLDAPVLATPAISDGRMFIRTKDEVLAFGN